MEPTEVSLELKFSRELKDGIWRGIQLGARGTLEPNETIAQGLRSLYKQLQAEGSILWGQWYKGAAQAAVGDEELDELPQPPPEEPKSEPADPSWCRIHECKMKRREKDGQVWYSHKAGDKWCNGS